VVIGDKDLLNRFGYHPPKNEVVVRQHETMRSTCFALAQLMDAALPDGREKSLAITKLEEATMWANAAIARHCNGDCPCHST
jgi:hypothetical protein